ncbi:MAG TPA: chemotaxis protein CheW [Bryobacteraceae bacterium]|nr:chemotaxis protein CheW [Bryobacteraceae bacterium]
MTQMLQRDWKDIHARLDRIRQILDREENPSPEAVARVWRERAQRYAASPESRVEGAASTDGDSVLVFRLGPDRYGIPVSSVREVLPSARIAPVPGAPATVAGLIQVRGEVRPVYDLRQRLQMPAAAPPPAKDGETVIVLTAAGRDFGIRVDAAEEIRTYRAEEHRQPGQSPWVAGVTEDLVSILNMESDWWGRKS